MPRRHKTSDCRDLQRYKTHGWLKFNDDVNLEKWVKESLPSARDALKYKQNQQWWRYQRSWFVGVNCLNNNSSGMVEGGIDLQGSVVSFLRDCLDADVHALDRAQISVCYPGYPQASKQESLAASRYRLNRDAAHIDGLLKEGAAAERFVREPNDYILGIGMTEFSPDASPLVVWQGSHHLARAEFSAFFARYEPQDWSNIAITECYKQLRKRIFKDCERIEIALSPGQAVLLHRLTLHGTAPWGQTAHAGPDGRMICFFRPSSLGISDWLNATIY